MEVLSDELASQKQLAIIERFEGFINYTYPIAINIRRTHYIARDRLIGAMFEQVSLFAQAGKSGQVSKLYQADAGLSDLRFMLRFLAHSREALAVLQAGLKWFIEQNMRLRFSHWSIIPVASGVSFLGYRIWPKYKLLLRPSVVRAKRKINRYTRLGLSEHLERFLGSWRGHAKWANSFNLMHKLGVA